MKNIESETKKFEMSDEDSAMFYIRHIQHPCMAETNKGIKNIRHIHLELAQTTLPSLRDSYQKQALEKLVDYYLRIDEINNYLGMPSSTLLSQ